jgi:hypothetical protein
MLTNLLDGLNSFGAAILENMGLNKNEAQREVTEVSQQYKECTKWRMTMNVYGPLLSSLSRQFCFLSLLFCYPPSALFMVSVFLSLF